MTLVLKTPLQVEAPVAQPVEMELRPREYSPFAESDVVSVRRTGNRPLRFKGSELMTATSHGPGPSLWYEIYVWRKAAGGFVLQIRMFGKQESTKDRFRAYEVDSIEEMAQILENYDTSADIDADIPVDDPSVPVTLIALRAAELRMKLDEARRQFSDLLGEVMHALEIY